MTLPNFIIAGAKKCGTTSMYEYLKQHPQVYMPVVKEPRFFAYNPNDPNHVKLPFTYFPIRTFEEYTQLFADANGKPAIGEASPMYISSPFALQQLRITIPHVKLVFCLRQPVERAYSLYLMRVRHNLEQRPPYQAFAGDMERWTRFKYYQMLKPWFEQFEPSQIQVLLYEDFQADSLRIMQEMFQFLGIDKNFTPDMKQKHGVGGVPKNKPLHRVLTAIRKSRYKKLFGSYLPASVRSFFTRSSRKNLSKAPAMPEDVRQFLTNLYAEDTVKLEGLLQRDLSIWKLKEKVY